jgi:hypothetical protein
MAKKLVTITLGSLIVTLIYSCGVLWGAHDLGNKLTLLEGDKTEDRLIVYCTGYSGGACMAGTPVIPSRQDSITLYVKDAESNKHWVIARSLRKQNRTEDYWIINKDFNIENLDCDQNDCDSIIQSHVKGPFRRAEFNAVKSQLGIHLGF